MQKRKGTKGRSDKPNRGNDDFGFFGSGFVLALTRKDLRRIEALLTRDESRQPIDYNDIDHCDGYQVTLLVRQIIYIQKFILIDNHNENINPFGPDHY